MSFIYVLYFIPKVQCCCLLWEHQCSHFDRLIKERELLLCGDKIKDVIHNVDRGYDLCDLNPISRERETLDDGHGAHVPFKNLVPCGRNFLSQS